MLHWVSSHYRIHNESVSQSVHPSVHPLVRLFICPFFRPSLCPSIIPSFGPSVSPSIHMSIRPSISQSINQSVMNCLLINDFQLLIFQMNLQPLCCSWWRINQERTQRALDKQATDTLRQDCISMHFTLQETKHFHGKRRTYGRCVHMILYIKQIFAAKTQVKQKFYLIKQECSN